MYYTVLYNVFILNTTTHHLVYPPYSVVPILYKAATTGDKYRIHPQDTLVAADVINPPPAAAAPVAPKAAPVAAVAAPAPAAAKLCAAAKADPATTFPMAACQPAATLPATTPAAPNPATPRAAPTTRGAAAAPATATPTMTIL